MNDIIIVPEAGIREGLKVVIDNYLDLSSTRCSRQDRMVNSALKGMVLEIRSLLAKNNPGMEVGIDNVRPVDRWPSIPWMAFGGPPRYMTDRGPFMININYHFKADMSGVILAILVNSEGWRERFDGDWPAKFEPFRNEFRTELTWMMEHGFRLDGDVDLATKDEDYLDLCKGYIVHKFYDAEELPSEEELQSDLIIACRAQQQLVGKGR